MSSFKTGTVMIGPLTVLGDTTVTWNHKLGVKAVKVEMLDEENSTNTSSKIFIKQIDLNNLNIVNQSASTFIITVLATFRMPSQSVSGVVSSSDSSITSVATP